MSQKQLTAIQTLSNLQSQLQSSLRRNEGLIRTRSATRGQITAAHKVVQLLVEDKRLQDTPHKQVVYRRTLSKYRLIIRPLE